MACPWRPRRPAPSGRRDVREPHPHGSHDAANSREARSVRCARASAPPGPDAARCSRRSVMEVAGVPVHQTWRAPRMGRGLPEPSFCCVSCRRGAMAQAPAPRPCDRRERDPDKPARMAARGICIVAGRIARDISPRHFLPIQVGNETRFVVQPQHKPADRRCRTDIEMLAKIGRPKRGRCRECRPLVAGRSEAGHARFP